jgi:hypothetical protein
MSSKIALRLAVLAFGTAFASAPALAQQYYQATPQSPGIGPNGDLRYGAGASSPSMSSGQAPYGQASGLYNQAPGMGAPGRCRLVITHRRGPNGSVTVRRRICD